MIFNEIYGVYYNAVAQILKEIIENEYDEKRIREIVQKQGFAESALTIEQKLKEQNWQLILEDGTTPIQHVPTMPLTILQKRWLKAMALDPRIQLFDLDFSELNDVDPLFTEEDFRTVDCYQHGDPYEDKKYQQIFRLILQAIKESKPVEIKIINRNGTKNQFFIRPKHLEYSPKDDRFRLIGDGYKYGVFNLAKIEECRIVSNEVTTSYTKTEDEVATVTLELYNQRNALERAMMHFAHLEKRVEKVNDQYYRITLQYYKSDETEMVIRILSFGPMIKVIEPDRFVQLIKERLKQQKICELK